jgi:hypothetical protein
MAGRERDMIRARRGFLLVSKDPNFSMKGIIDLLWEEG